MNFEVWPEAIELGRMFAAEGYELALVGGPVRDLLLHRKSHDLDFCTSARPEQFEHILRRFGHDGFWDMGRKCGTRGAMVEAMASIYLSEDCIYKLQKTILFSLN